ncbi:MAG: DUF177 domain-containing protein [Bacteroidetes bacterium]|nr:DUF177 domain-containing protein [Bacteroidota bacterium]
MIIKYTNYSDGVHHIELKKSAEKLNLGEPFTGDVLLNCKMDKSLSQIACDCELSVKLNLTCDRCTKEFTSERKAEFQIIYLFSKEGIEEDDINVHYLSPEIDKINLSEDTIEYCKLSIPLKILCDENCKGLCLKCGADLNKETCGCVKENFNPVWDELKKLKDRSNN